MQSGSSSYKCVKCVKRPDPPAALLSCANGTGDTPTEKSASCPELASTAGGSISPNVVVQMQKMAAQIDALTFKVRQLRAEDVTLRVQIRDLLVCVMGQTDFPHLRCSRQPAPPVQSFACVAATRPGFSGEAARSQYSAARPMHKIHHTLAKPLSNATRPPATLDIVKQRTLQVTPKALAVKGPFVYRLAPGTMVSDVQEPLEGFIADRTMKCARLKTKHHSYSFLHVSMDERLRERVNKPEV